VYRYRRKLSWTVSIFVSFAFVGFATEIASPFMGLNGQDAVSGAVALFVVLPFWVWSYKRGRFPIIKIGSPSRQEQAKFDAWRAAHQEAERAEFHAWKAAKAAASLSPGAAKPEPPSPLPTDSF
jgi:hypothetical protein